MNNGDIRSSMEPIAMAENRWRRRVMSLRASLLVRLAFPCLLAVYCLIGLTFLIRQTQRLFLARDIGYGDSYVMFDVLHFQRLGTIYRDLSQAPYLAAVYSPAMYVVYALPGRLLHLANFFIGPRLVALAFFIACLAITASIARALVPGSYRGLWSVLLSCSIAQLPEWVLQIRSDFPGITFSLLAVRLLISRGRWAVPLAGLCAGLAVQFKITFVAAGIVGTAWLAARRQWRDLGVFVATGAIASIGLYLLYSLREPAMLSQIFALSPGIADVRGAAVLASRAATNFVVVLAVLGLFRLPPATNPRAALILGFALVSFLVGALTAIQSGANANYFFEALFAVVPFAVLGVGELFMLAKRSPGAGVFVAALIGIYVVVPQARVLRDDIQSSEPMAVQNARFRALEHTLSGEHIFSTVPRIALLDSNPALVEPYLLTYSTRLGKVDPGPVISRVQRGEFDVAITSATALEWRHVLHILPSLRQAIAASYQPNCTLGGWLVQLPRASHAGSAALASRLSRIGCAPYDAAVAPAW
jgi:hypothetical protein